MQALLTSPMSWVAIGPGLVSPPTSVLTTALAYLLYARGLRTTAVTTATTLGLADPPSPRSSGWPFSAST